MSVVVFIAHCIWQITCSVDVDSVPQSIGIMPSIKLGSGPITWPAKTSGDWSVTGSRNAYNTLASPSQVPYKKSLNLQSAPNSIDAMSTTQYGSPHQKSYQYYEPMVEESVNSYAKIPRNLSSRFFTFNTQSKSLDLGISFTVPFVSMPLDSLLNAGQQTTTAITELFSVNWPSFLVVGAILLGATLLLPKVAPLIIAALSKHNVNYKSEDEPTSSYVQYMRSLEVLPFTSILDQIDRAMEEFDLDSTSCMQRVVCSYAASSDEKVSSGQASSANLIISGLTKSSVISRMLGDNALTQALEAGGKGNSCSTHFKKCPVSLPGILGIIHKMSMSQR